MNDDPTIAFVYVNFSRPVDLHQAEVLNRGGWGAVLPLERHLTVSEDIFVATTRVRGLLQDWKSIG